MGIDFDALQLATTEILLGGAANETNATQPCRFGGVAR